MTKTDAQETADGDRAQGREWTELLSAISDWLPPENQNACRNDLTMARRQRIIAAYTEVLDRMSSGQYVCDGCSNQYERDVRKPQPQRRNYCRTCREDGTAERVRKRGQREKAASPRLDTP